MLFGLSYELIVSYIVFRSFRFYMQLHIKNFRGSSESFVNVLSVWVLMTTAFHLYFLFYFGSTTTWWNPVKLIALHYAALLPLTATETYVSQHFPSTPYLLSVAGFVVIPLCGFLMIESF